MPWSLLFYLFQFPLTDIPVEQENVRWHFSSTYGYGAQNFQIGRSSERIGLYLHGEQHETFRTFQAGIGTQIRPMKNAVLLVQPNYSRDQLLHLRNHRFGLRTTAIYHSDPQLLSAVRLHIPDLSTPQVELELRQSYAIDTQWSCFAGWHLDQSNNSPLVLGVQFHQEHIGLHLLQRGIDTQLGMSYGREHWRVQISLFSRGDFPASQMLYLP